MGIDARLPTLLLLVATFASALYFPQSNLTLRLPHPRHNGDDLSSDVILLKVRTLRNDSTVPKDPKYQIVAPPEKFAYLDHKNGNVILHALPKGGAPITITLQARERSREMASSEIQIQPVPVNERKINCSNFLQDICFWGTSKYRVYENKPVTMLGKMGPDIYRSLCPHFQITTYELLNGTDHFHIINNELFSNASLDRDTVGPPGGPGAHVEVLVKCVVWEETTGLQHRLEKILEIDILDEDDNPPVSQTNGHLVIPLRDFMVGARLDRNDLIVKDADAVDSNRYAVHILGDVENALNITFDKMVVDLKQPPSTAIFIRIFSKLTLLPRSPYHVILQVTDETLLPGYGNKSTNISLTFDGPRHYTTTSTTAAPPKAPIAFPGAIKISRGSSQFTRVVQPFPKPTPDTRFSLHGSKALEITREDGIVYVSNTTLLESSGPTIPVKIEWRGPRRNVSFVSLVITVVDAPRSGVDQCNHSCANAAKSRQCEASCGVGSGVFQGDKFVDKCAWRDNARKTMTQYYGTCSPTLTYCPNFECDALERLDHRICPQDCIVEAEGHFVKINAEGRGIREGMDVCSCNDDMQCFCGPGAYQPTGSHKGGGKEGDKGKKDRDKDSLALPGARKAASSGPCGPTCLIGIVGASLFVLVVIIGTFGVWRFRMATKESRRECKHRREGGSNGLGILPSDYVDRGDGLLIGLDSLTTVNRTLLVPKTCPPDPKWEFPRSRLTIEQVLGEGEFGRVLRAKAVEIGGWQGPTTVAVKTLKEGACASELADLLSEYQLLKEAQHPNVIRLLGACTSPGGPVYLIIEFAEFGSLRNYLRRSRHLESEGTTPCTSSLLSASPCNVREDVQNVKSPSNYGITPRDILSFAWQISKGMAYLADIKLVHRDLAARNVLLATGKVCKISDFGLTRDVYEDDAYLKRSKGRVPVKWMAPESLADHVYTSKSDVWSFGILLWELVTLGASPYPGVDVHNLYNLLKAGYRMEKPANCSQQLYKLMVSCWHEEPGMRPSFKELTCQWERMLEDGVEYLDLNPRTVHNQAYFSSLHALDSPANSGSDEVSYGNINIRTDAVNYCTKESSEPVTKCDKIDKLQALWQEPIASFPPEPLKPPYANDRVIDRNVNHYESPIKRRNSSVTNNEQSNLKTPPNERPQSYIDMEGKRPKEQEDLLLFNNVDKRPDFDVLSNGLAM